MGRKLSGFGIILLLVVMAIVLVLVARAWKAVAPRAIQVTEPRPPGAAPSSGGGRTEVVEGAGTLPDLNEMRRNTGQHSRQVQEIQDQIDR